jgi:predicted DNA-binding transcriptional regulator YafY
MIAALRPEMRARVQGLAQRVHVRGEPVGITPERSAVYSKTLEALERKVQVRLAYRDRDTLALDTTKVSPYRLLVDCQRWYLIGRSTQHRAVKVFHLPWVERLELTGEPAVVPSRFDLERFLGQAWVVERGKRLKVVLRFSPRAAREVGEQQWHSSQRVEPREDGGLDLYLNLEGHDELIGWILSFADQVKVISPPELRTHVQRICKRMAQLNESD